jgi:glutaredoxin
VQVVLVTRQGCHLCDHALELLREAGVEPEMADVDSDEELYRLYDWRVPVVLVDGAVVAEGKIDIGGVQRALARTPRPKP